LFNTFESPLIEVFAHDSGHVVDINEVRCTTKTRKGTMCGAVPGAKGRVGIAINRMGALTLSGTCGTHINRTSGDYTRTELLLWAQPMTTEDIPATEHVNALALQTARIPVSMRHVNICDGVRVAP